ncbi:MAG TPA: type II toxin-antitoxin system VapC family toxin [Candidatus Sulfotelmatobacter sp.]|jgi:tRNA(fMet)-specific endonuclease VapC|nr:type II toxin-antitoxin system VapC family toxin [Candidatus Sulfotelmatobacter sp.]
MEFRYLLDTNIFIYIRQERKEVVRHFVRLRPGEAAVSIISYGELFFGASKRGRAEDLEQLRVLMGRLPCLTLPEAAAETYGVIRAELESRGEVISNNDLWIAAHALASGLTLVTNNVKEFHRVPRLKIQNWAA